MFVHPESKDGEASTSEGGAGGSGANARFVAKNLVNLVNESRAGELASLEEVVSSLVKDTLDPEKETVLDPEVKAATIPASVEQVCICGGGGGV